VILEYNVLTLCSLENCPILNRETISQEEREKMYNQCLHGSHQCKEKDISQLIELNRQLIAGAMA